MKTYGSPIVLTLLGKPVAKKNAKRTIQTKSGKWKAVYGKAQDDLDRLALQIPGEYRDLKLEHPDIEFDFKAPKFNWDRDNAVTTAVDLLVDAGVLKNDSVASCNGIITLFPCERAEYWETKIRIYPKGK